MIPHDEMVFIVMIIAIAAFGAIQYVFWTVRLDRIRYQAIAAELRRQYPDFYAIRLEADERVQQRRKAVR